MVVMKEKKKKIFSGIGTRLSCLPYRRQVAMNTFWSRYCRFASSDGVVKGSVHVHILYDR
jgi:hypothetical protein